VFNYQDTLKLEPPATLLYHFIRVRGFLSKVPVFFQNMACSKFICEKLGYPQQYINIYQQYIIAHKLDRLILGQILHDYPQQYINNISTLHKCSDIHHKTAWLISIKRCPILPDIPYIPIAPRSVVKSVSTQGEVLGREEIQLLGVSS